MTDREKVIKGLESLHRRLLDAATLDSIAMLDANMVSDALALLKTQMPNIYSWQDIIDDSANMPFIWLESKNIPDRVFQSILFKTWLFDSVATIITVMTGGWLFEGHKVDYGKTWRCWTSLPTEEQRKAVAWIEA